MRTHRLFPLPLLLLLLVGLVATLAAAPASAEPVTARLVDVRAASHAGFDRVVFEFDGPLPANRVVRYEDELREDASGAPVRVSGRAILAVTMFQADAHDADGTPTAPRRVAFGLPNVLEAVNSGDFEATVTYGIGLAQQQDYSVFTLTEPSRVVVDIRVDYPTVWKRVYFLDRERYAAGSEPYTRPVLRRVPAATPANGLMHQLFAGPTGAERADGLRLVRSQAWGADVFAISDTVARVKLRRSCDSGGSTFTVADLVLPTLKQLANVDAVKVYDPSGRTQEPAGRTDSVPACLEP